MFSTEYRLLKGYFGALRALPDWRKALAFAAEALASQLGLISARFWLIGPGDRCAACANRAICAEQARCLHLLVSGGDVAWADDLHLRVPFAAYPVGQIAASGRALLLEELAGCEEALEISWAKARGVRVFYGLPLEDEQGLLGVLGVFAANPLTREQRTLLRELAPLATGALRGLATYSETHGELGALLMASPDVVFLCRFHEEGDTGPIARIVECNAAALAALGCERDAVVGAELGEVFQVPGSPTGLLRLLEELCAGHEVREVSANLRTKSGSALLVMANLSPVLGRNGAGSGCVCVARDLGRLLEIEEGLRRAHREVVALSRIGHTVTSSLDIREVYAAFAEEMRALVDFDIMNILVLDREGHGLEVLASLGESPVHLPLGAKIPVVGTVEGYSAQTSRPVLIRDLARTRRFSVTWRLWDRKVRSMISVPLVTKGKPLGAFNVGGSRPSLYSRSDQLLLQRVADQLALAVENSRLYRQTEELAITDGLTGLFNHRHFHLMLQQEIAKAKRLDYYVGLLMIDVDDFKSVNDRYGHIRGDRVLQAVASWIASGVRTTDTVARYGGEEFAVILPGCRDEHLAFVADKVRDAVAQSSLSLEGVEEKVRLTVSVGAACYPADEVEANLLLRRADAALYEAKSGGKNRVVLAHRHPPLPNL